MVSFQAAEWRCHVDPIRSCDRPEPSGAMHQAYAERGEGFNLGDVREVGGEGWDGD